MLNHYVSNQEIEDQKLNRKTAHCLIKVQILYKASYSKNDDTKSITEFSKLS